MLLYTRDGLTSRSDEHCLCQKAITTSSASAGTKPGGGLLIETFFLFSYYMGWLSEHLLFFPSLRLAFALHSSSVSRLSLALSLNYTTEKGPRLLSVCVGNDLFSCISHLTATKRPICPYRLYCTCSRTRASELPPALGGRRGGRRARKKRRVELYHIAAVQGRTRGQGTGR